MIAQGVVVHGGVGSPRTLDDGCDRAAEAGFHVLRGGGDAVEAVIEATRVLEDDGRFNAGSGSIFRMDGTTIEMDGSLMDSAGRIGVVAAIQRVRNPILVARQVMDTPHVILSGEGAAQFARARGFPDYYQPSAIAREKFEKARRLIKESRIAELRHDWAQVDIRAMWNFTRSYDEVFGSDTVGAVAIDRRGLLASANSTGGATPMLLGRLGDSPIVGCGFFAGPAAAVATTGIGEEIIRRQAARQVYDRISFGEEVQRACEVEVSRFPPRIAVGIIAISRRGIGVAGTQEMARGVRSEES
jgi:L-asparaginase/beta-aspartyl-peptidase (threonine type)